MTKQIEKYNKKCLFIFFLKKAASRWQEFKSPLSQCQMAQSNGTMLQKRQLLTGIYLH
jgi:flagellar biosynthesis/type III secretory pathway chaperone